MPIAHMDLVAAALAGAAAWPILARLLGTASRVVSERRTRRAADLMSTVGPEPEFRRPVEWGPVSAPWDELERVRLAIFADQVVARTTACAGAAEPADLIACTGDDQRALTPEGTVAVARAGGSESTGELERFHAWLQHWHEDGLAALTCAA